MGGGGAGGGVRVSGLFNLVILELRYFKAIKEKWEILSALMNQVKG